MTDGAVLTRTSINPGAPISCPRMATTNSAATPHVTPLDPVPDFRYTLQTMSANSEWNERI